MENKSITITEDEYVKATVEAIDVIMSHKKEDRGSMTNFAIGLSASMAFVELRKILFDDEEVAKQ